LKVYVSFSTRPWEYAYGAAYTKRQFARLTGSNLYILEGLVGIEKDPKNIKNALEKPFFVFYPPNPPSWIFALERKDEK
jgi:hypothetical protein